MATDLVIQYRGLAILVHCGNRCQVTKQDQLEVFGDQGWEPLLHNVITDLGVQYSGQEILTHCGNTFSSIALGSDNLCKLW